MHTHHVHQAIPYYWVVRKVMPRFCIEKHRKNVINFPTPQYLHISFITECMHWKDREKSTTHRAQSVCNPFLQLSWPAVSWTHTCSLVAFSGLPARKSNPGQCVPSTSASIKLLTTSQRLGGPCYKIFHQNLQQPPET